MSPLPVRGRIGVSAALLCLGAALSFCTAPTGRLGWILEGLRTGAESSPGAFYFFLHNTVVLFSVISGLLTFGFASAVALVSVGFLTFAPVSGALKSGVPWPIILATLLPHGVVEIAALVSGGAAGLLGLDALVLLCRGGGVDGLKPLARTAGRLIALAVIGLSVAATLEAYVTPIIVKYVVVSP